MHRCSAILPEQTTKEKSETAHVGYSGGTALEKTVRIESDGILQLGIHQQSKSSKQQPSQQGSSRKPRGRPRRIIWSENLCLTLLATYFIIISLFAYFIIIVAFLIMCVLHK